MQQSLWISEAPSAVVSEKMELMDQLTIEKNEMLRSGLADNIAYRNGVDFLKSVRREFSHTFFEDPVDPVKHNAPDYFDVIKCPMHLLEVERKLREGIYTTLGGFFRDVLLIWDNAMTYNHKGHAVHEAARFHHHLTEKYITSLISRHNLKRKKQAGSPPSPVGVA
eukprot:CAMPEP_0194603536 /NCGR_PEP_ID=MMETSP0292-20121207/30313_1 /TAXON_ID=39354 /ORGANISM="Heterosigma akashiwo, Strain CCMP2393" /LENGTH=165 /DNA_ID=CAMNT_0039466007 /DNA_START=172 /DNA_END=665 /DNA_ORIENTATION=-